MSKAPSTVLFLVHVPGVLHCMRIVKVQNYQLQLANLPPENPICH